MCPGSILGMLCGQSVGFFTTQLGGKNYLQDQKTYVDGLLYSRHCWEACKIHEHA